MVTIPDIRNQCSGIREGSSSECTSQESENKDRSCIFGQSASNLETDVGDKGNDENWTTAKDLR